ncbi:tripartite tricarboxylate transporter substrate binding protein [Cupriavidus sp. 2TAF22]|uniref:tripartite tricarboxylate transporter substrate binding protein n=1 Tax=unclassified Cupriavidus TaxID=2640874 RepID=UPI003F92FFD8
MNNKWLCISGATLVLAASAVSAQDSWPARPITMVVPFAPGGVADAVARPVAEALSRELHQPVVVDNRGGAGGGIGMGYVAKAAPDGYTVLMALSSISMIPEADKVIGRKPLFQLDQLKPIARFTADPTVLVVRADSPWQTAKDFITDVKSHPGRYSYGSSGNYGTMHVPMAMLADQAGLSMLHVPYTGAGPAVVALMGGQVDAVSTGPSSVLQFIKGGKLRALAQWGNNRLAALPDVPSLMELGHNVEFAQWSGLFVPAGTPDPVIKRLRDAARIAAADPKVNSVIQNAGSPVLYMDSPQFQAYWDKDAGKIATAVRKIGKVE